MANNKYIIILFISQIITFLLLLLRIHHLHHDTLATANLLAKSQEELASSNLVLAEGLDKTQQMQSFTVDGIILEGLILIGIVVILLFFGGKGGEGGAGTSFTGNNPGSSPALKSVRKEDFPLYIFIILNFLGCFFIKIPFFYTTTLWDLFSKILGSTSFL